MDGGPGSPQGQRVGRYVLERRLGRGAMGEVWLGRDVVTEGPAAVKLLTDGSGPAARAQLEREYRAIALLDHPNIVHLYELGPGHLATAYLDGATLERRLQTALEPARAMAWALQLASALAHAHSRGVVHRDVKPANVLLDRRGNVFLADFGLAVFEGEAAAQRGGTPRYMAPEQWERSQVGPAADQYGLARTLVAMLAGGPPEEDPETALAALRDDLPEPLIAALRRAQSRDPDDRFPDVGALADALASVDLGALGAREAVAASKRPAEPVAWLGRPDRVVDFDHDIARADYRLSAVGLDAAWAAFQEDTGYGELGWSVFGRTSRLGPVADPQAAARASEVVVLLHGWGNTREVWFRVARQLCLENAELLVLVPDVQGFGASRFASPWPAPEHAAPTGLYEAIRRWREALGLEALPTVLVGHSMSGIAVLVGRDPEEGRRPYRVSIAPPWLAAHWLLPLWARAGALIVHLLARLGPAIRLITDSVSVGQSSQRMSAEMRGRMVQNMRAVAPGTLARISDGVALGLDPSPDAIPRTLLLAGDADPMLRATPLQAIAEQVGFPRSHVRVLSTATHYPHISDPEHPEHTARNTAEIVSAVEAMLVSCRDPTVTTGGTPVAAPPAADTLDWLASDPGQE